MPGVIFGSTFPYREYDTHTSWLVSVAVAGTDRMDGSVIINQHLIPASNVLQSVEASRERRPRQQSTRTGHQEMNHASLHRMSIL